MSLRIVIIGAGFGGLGAAIELRRAGFTDVTVLERAEAVGGVWRDNTYPGAACDVPSPLYSWSFAPNPRWERRYSGQADILRYLTRVAREEGVLDQVVTDAEVTRCRYDDTAGVWAVRTTDGRSFTADLLVGATGQLSQPVIPDIAGRDTFSGPAFHSAQWRHDVDLTGARVAVVGTGASAIQIVPNIVDRVGALTVFQRSAPYVVPKPDRAYLPLHHAVFSRAPALQRLGRITTYRLSELLNGSLASQGRLTCALERVWRAMLVAQVHDPDLRRKLVPHYPIGCKRLLFSNDWYPALTRPHVEVETTHVVEVVPQGLRTADDVVHPADVIVWGTGFAATDFLGPISVTGAGGRGLDDVWADGAHAYLGLAVPGFPDFFLMYGPNTNLGGSSIIGMLEGQARYVAQAARHRAAGRSLDVRPEVAAAYDEEMQRRLAESVWAGCTSWYSDRGRITTNWPGTVTEYRERVRTLDLTDFRVGAASEPEQPTQPSTTTVF
jgi:cation diffusion facilitator CzcD-associated flavoprotein CzcO